MFAEKSIVLRAVGQAEMISFKFVSESVREHPVDSVEDEDIEHL